MFFRKKAATRTFNDVLTTLGEHKFDVSPAKDASGGAYRVTKYGCAAEIAPTPAATLHEKGATVAPAEIVTRAGWLLNGQIARLEDRGYQKFLKTSKLEIAATADVLKAIHQFNEELKDATGAMSLYNQSLGTTSDRYVYDRVKGREHNTPTSDVSGHRGVDPLQRSSAVAIASDDDASDL